jgi:hypothetical protein
MHPSLIVSRGASRQVRLVAAVCLACGWGCASADAGTVAPAERSAAREIDPDLIALRDAVLRVHPAFSGQDGDPLVRGDFQRSIDAHGSRLSAAERIIAVYRAVASISARGRDGHGLHRLAVAALRVR